MENYQKVTDKDPSQNPNYEETKKFIEGLFLTVSDLSLNEIKKYFEKLSKERAAKNDLTELLNSCREGKKKTILHFAAARGDIDIFKYILTLGLKLDAEDEEKNTPFFTAV